MKKLNDAWRQFGSSSSPNWIIPTTPYYTDSVRQPCSEQPLNSRVVARQWWSRPEENGCRKMAGPSSWMARQTVARAHDMCLELETRCCRGGFAE